MQAYDRLTYSISTTVNSLLKNLVNTRAPGGSDSADMSIQLHLRLQQKMRWQCARYHLALFIPTAHAQQKIKKDNALGCEWSLGQWVKWSPNALKCISANTRPHHLCWSEVGEWAIYTPATYILTACHYFTNIDIEAYSKTFIVRGSIFLCNWNSLRW